ncbi:MAG: elongation factor G [Ruminococcaceae bacterium]|nr:elongation factor G [Oscillospiraceae bacterium]
MKTYHSDNIRNIVVAGHAGRGKTTLCEAMLYVAGAIKRLGKVTDGTTVMDFDAEEKKRGSSLQSAVASFECNKVKVNLIDTPGLFDFAGGLIEAVRAAGCMLIVTDAEKAKYDVGAEKAFAAAESRNLSKFFVINKTDAENANFGNLFEELHAIHGNKLCPVVVPYIENNKIKHLVNFAQNKAYDYKDGKAVEVDMPTGEKLEAMREMFNESVATASDELMEKYFAGEPFTEEDALEGLLTGVAEGSIYPVYACSGATLQGVDLLLNGIVNLAPSATAKAGEIATDASGNEVELPCDVNGPLAAICFKTIADPFVGKLSYVKVVSGKITADTPCYCARTTNTERVGKIAYPHGGKQEDATEITAGDIAVITKLSGIKTGDTITDAKNPLTLEGLDLPTPCTIMATKTTKKGDEDKIAQGLIKLMEEDPTISFYTNPETKEQVLAGIGEQHIDAVIAKLKTKFGVEVKLEPPKIAYRETIKKKVEAQGRYKKQSGGHGQYGDVWIRFEPCETPGLEFAEEVFGGAVPKNFFPAVEKGLEAAIEKGVLAGYPMVGLKATLYDGSYHPVDSSEMAFKTAASLAYKEGMPKANPTLLEPIQTLTAEVPDDNMGDIMGDITKRRGRVLGMEQIAGKKGMQQLVAEVPEAELFDFSTVLRSVTKGRGSFGVEFARYEEVPESVATKIIEESQAEAE